MKSIAVALIMMSGCYAIYAADRSVGNISIDRIKSLANPNNVQQLSELLKRPHELSQRTKDALLNQAFLQKNSEAILLLAQAGAFVEGWMRENEVLRDIFNIRGVSRNSEEYKKLRDKIDYMREQLKNAPNRAR